MNRKNVPALALLVLVVALVMALFVGPGSASAVVTGLETKSATASAAADEIKSVGVSCSSGKKALGGGVEVDPYPVGSQQIVSSAPNGATGDGSDNAWGWVALVHNTDTSARNVTVWVICATIGS